MWELFWEFLKPYIAINQSLAVISVFSARNGYYSRIRFGVTYTARILFSRLGHLLLAVHAQMSHRELSVHGMQIVNRT